MATPIYDFWEQASKLAKSFENEAGKLAPAMIEKLMQNMSLRQIARRVKRSPTYISHVMNRKANCSMLTFRVLEQLYNQEFKR